MEWYYSNMHQIVRILVRETPARIAIASPPVLGEDLSSLPNERLRAYSALLLQIALQERVTYLPVHEKQEEYLRRMDRDAGRPHDATSMIMWTSILRHYILRQSLEAIAQQNRFTLTTEGLHLNVRGAAIVVDTIEAYLRSSY